jgi:hypothetical protein
MRKQNLFARAISSVVLLTVVGFTWAAQDAAGQPAEKDSQLKLKKSLLDAARKAYAYEAAMDKGGDPAYRFSSDRFARYSRRWLNAQLELTATNEARIAAFREHLDRMHELDNKVKLAIKANEFRIGEAAISDYHRIQAELWLEQAKTKTPQK